MTLTHENYYSLEASAAYMSVSQLKAFDECEAAAMAQLRGEYKSMKTTPLLVGGYVDAFFAGELDEFKEANPEIFCKNGKLRSDYAKADEIIERIQRDDYFYSFFGGEIQPIITSNIAGVDFKCKIDFLHDDKIVDLKVMRDFAPIYLPNRGRVNFIEAWHYDLQGAIYQEIVRQKTGKKLPFYIAAATKEEVTDLAIIQVPQEVLDFELEAATERIPYYAAVKKGVFEAERCGNCNYCKSTKKLNAPMSWDKLCNNDFSEDIEER
ncbi:MAG: PD-(D/E)XK nuclease-like domain-containing protein [Clostridia bacterium]|nr:PD-(D/E)XK nuclease-like domain-containing protein [Clostridia bacterium]